jgi:hypothetical protein
MVRIFIGLVGEMDCGFNYDPYCFREIGDLNSCLTNSDLPSTIENSDPETQAHFRARVGG